MKSDRRTNGLAIHYFFISLLFLWFPIIGVLLILATHDRRMNEEKLKNNSKSLREEIIDILGGDVSKEHILEVCDNRGIKYDVGETVYLYMSNSKEGVADTLLIDGSTVIRRVKRFINKATYK